MQESSLKEIPKYWERLSDEDKQKYKLLKATFGSATKRNQRNRSRENFLEIINTLKAFIVRNQPEDRDRMLVCGICWLTDNVIAINTRQLKLILSRSKSTINGSFQSLGYGTVQSGMDSAPNLIKLFPEFQNNYPELRQWTVRQPLNATPTPQNLQQFLRSINNADFITPPPSSFPQMPAEQSYGINIGYQMPASQQLSMSAPPRPIDPPELTFTLPDPIPEEKILYSPEQTLSFDNDDFANFNWANDDYF